MASKASAAVVARVMEIAREHARDSRTYVATSHASTPVLSEHIDVLSAPDGATVSASALHAALELSKLVDFVQDGGLEFRSQSLGASFVTDVYQQVVRNVEFAHASLTPEQQATFERAEAILYDDAPFVRTEPYARFAELRAEIASLAIDRSESMRTLDQADEAEKEMLQDRIDSLDAELDAKRELLKALDAEHSLSQAEEIYQSTKISGFPPSYQRAHEILGDPAFQLTSPLDNQSHWPASFFPLHLTEENWIPLKLTQADIASVSDELLARLPKPPHAANRIEFIDDALDTIELEVQFLHVDRPWLWSGLLENRLWRFRTDAEPLSNGEEPPRGQLPAFVTGLIFARNIRLSGKKALVRNMIATNVVVNLGNFLFRSIESSAATRIKLRSDVQPLSSLPDQLAPAAPARPTGAVRASNVRDHRPTVTVRAPDVRDHRSTATVRVRRPGATRATRKESGVVRGMAVDNSGQPLAGVAVTLLNLQTNRALTSRSVRDGSFVFPGITEDHYEIKAQKQGFQSFEKRMRLGPNSQFKAILKSQVVANVSLVNAMGPALLTALRPSAIRHILKKTLTVQLRKRTEEGVEGPLDVPTQIVVIDQRTKKRHPLTATPGKDAVFKLDAGRYQVVVHCGVYDPVGSTSRTIEVKNSHQIAFTFQPRTILQSDDTFLVGFLCYRTPKSPNPDESAEFED